MVSCPNLFGFIMLYSRKKQFFHPLAVLRLDIGGNNLRKIPNSDVIFENLGDLQERLKRQGKEVKSVCIGHNFVAPNFQDSN